MSDMGARYAVYTLLNEIRLKDSELAEAKEQIAAYQVRVDNDALRLANLAHPVTADRFSRG